MLHLTDHQKNHQKKFNVFSHYSLFLSGKCISGHHLDMKILMGKLCQSDDFFYGRPFLKSQRKGPFRRGQKKKILGTMLYSPLTSNHISICY